MVCLFFTYGISLKRWDELGILDRETALYKSLVAKGVKVGLFTYGGSKDLDYAKQLSGIEIIPAYANKPKPRNNKIAFLQSLTLPFQFKEKLSDYSIFKTNQMWGAWIALIAKWLLRKKLLVRCGFEHYYTLVAENHSKFTKLWFYWLSWLVYHCAEHIILTAEYISNFVQKTFHISKSKISVCPNYIDTELFSPKEPQEKLNKRILFIGRLSQEKNLFALIEACKNAGVGLDLAGEGILREELNNFSRKVNADTVFLGILPNSQMPSLIAKYPIFILSSFYEGNPKAMLEAMSCQRAVIGSDVGGIREVISEGENGIICGTKTGDISSAIKRLIDDQQLQLELGKNAREYVVKNASIAEVLEKEIKVYKSITNK